jgi:hypothetical protein
MNYPPLSLRLRIAGPGIPSLNLWLPLFLVWPILFALLVFLSPLLLILFAVGYFVFSIRLDVFLFLAGVYQTLCALKGLRVEVDGPPRQPKVFIQVH